MKNNNLLQHFSDLENAKADIVCKAINWQFCMSFEYDAKPGKNYYKQRADMESKVFNELFLAVERYRKINAKKESPSNGQ